MDFASARRPEPWSFEESLRLASSVGSERQRLCRLWIAARELIGIIQDSLRDEYWLTQWNRFLRCWNNSAAWYGLHGHAELGYLSALHSLDDVCQGARSANPALVDDPDWDRPLGSLGSAYYAAAKRVASRAFRRRGLAEGSRLPGSGDVQRRSRPLERSCGSWKRAPRVSRVHPLRLTLTEPSSDFARRAGPRRAPSARLWRNSALAFCSSCARPEALSRLREGVRLMEDAGYGAGFLVRAKRKYTDRISSNRSNLGGAASARVEAQELARRASIGTAG